MTREIDEFEGELRPTATSAIGMWLFLAALTMLFAASLLAYGIIRTRAAARGNSIAIELPNLLWASTGLMLAASIALQSALTGIRQGRRAAMRNGLVAGGLLAIGFVAMQGFCLARVLASHASLRTRGSGLYGLVFFLIVLHALHVLGGLMALGRVLYRSGQAVYGRASHEQVRFTVLYWHFLDIVWLLMFGVMWGLR